MPVIERSALLPFPAATVFAVVDDVARYPEFLPWCAAADVLEASGDLLVAELALAGRGIRERFTTRNLRVPHERIELELVSGPFRSFAGTWTFTPIGVDAGCRVALALEFEFSGARALFGSAFSGVFVKAADQMVDAFCARVRALHG